VAGHQRIDVLVNNAGFAVAGFAEDMELDELRQQLDTNFFGHVAMTKAVLPTMRAQRFGHIIMLSSILGLIGSPVVSSYCASKHALEGWTESVRVELRSLGIKMVLVEPGAYQTDIWQRNAIVCRKSFDPASPNLERLKRHGDHLINEVPKRDPREVALLITRIARDPDPTLRYLAGSDAKIASLLSRLLPWSMWERMMEKRSKI
jgi:short-subunit dehydrogenase